jgi:transposase-like protein
MPRLRPTVSGKWHADETEVKVNGKYAYMWNVMDSKTRFLIAKLLSFGRGSKEATKLLTRALNRTGKEPRSLITDGLKSYGAAIDAKQIDGSMRSTAHHANGLQDAETIGSRECMGQLRNALSCSEVCMTSEQGDYSQTAWRHTTTTLRHTQLSMAARLPNLPVSTCADKTGGHHS